jgi:formylglycine-generating enzyme required for sulfatase activity
MTGNVREWCQDFFESGYYAKSPELNPQGPEQGERRIVRGGSFNNPDGSCFVTYRSYSSPDIKNKYTGLRLAYSEE